MGHSERHRTDHVLSRAGVNVTPAAIRLTPPTGHPPLALPADAYLRNWIARAVAHWQEARGSDLPIPLAPSPASASEMADLLAGLALG